MQCVFVPWTFAEAEAEVRIDDRCAEVVAFPTDAEPLVATLFVSILKRLRLLHKKRSYDSTQMSEPLCEREEPYLKAAGPPLSRYSAMSDIIFTTLTCGPQ